MTSLAGLFALYIQQIAYLHFFFPARFYSKGFPSNENLLESHIVAKVLDMSEALIKTWKLTWQVTEPENI